MLTNEVDAKVKWCPFSRVNVLNALSPDGTGAASVNRGEQSYLPKMTRCLGSECMGWRNVTEDADETGKEIIVGGYCGLAGKPLEVA